MVNLEVGVEYGGVVYAGDRVDNQHVYYPMQFNKKAGLALKKGDVVYADPADNGNVRLAKTGDLGPFMMVYGDQFGNDVPAGATRVHCWHDEYNWLLANIVGTAQPNTKLIPGATTNEGKLIPVGADTTTGVYAILLGSPDQEAELTSGNVLQQAVTDGLGVIKVYNIPRLATA